MKYCLVILSLFIHSYLFSQDIEEKNTKLDFAFSPGIILQHQFFSDVNIIVGKVTVDNGKIPIVGISGVRLGFESNFKDGKDFIIAPKIGYEISATIFTIRLSAANYFNNSKSEFRIIPELGISVLGFANLTYGYGIPINKSDIYKLSHHRVSLTINLNKKLSREVFQ